MDPHGKVLNRVISCTLGIGLLYFLFCVYYAAKRLQHDNWNLRQSQFRPHIWANDPDLEKIRTRMANSGDNFSSEVTIITAYFNIGSLNKGGLFWQYTPEKYVKWMSVFGRINNSLIVFTDSTQVKEIFNDIRKGFPKERTKIFLIDREELWAFKLAPEIKQVFSQPNYPDHDPNTVHENYSCVMHAKFELVNKVIYEGLYNTKYIAWLDIGLFRAVVYEKHAFHLSKPPNFDETKVAYSGQRKFDPTLTPFEIVAGNKVWVGGAMFLAVPEVLYIYTKDYMRAVRKLLDMKIMSTDQQVVYIMYQPSFDFQPRIEIQTYTTHSDDDWFYLGYMLKDAWDISLRKAEPVVRFILPLMT